MKTLAFLAALLCAGTAQAATNFLEYSGTNGYVGSCTDLLSTELNSLAAGSAVTSSVGGSSGVFTQTDTGHAAYAAIFYENKNSGSWTITNAPGPLNIWFLTSPDGTNFETPVVTPSTALAALSRSPDVVIEIGGASYPGTTGRALSNFQYSRLPSGPFKVLLQNMTTTATMPSSGQHITLCPVTIQY